MIKERILRIFLIIIILVPYFIKPVNVYAKEAETLRELRQQLKKLEQENAPTLMCRGALGHSRKFITSQENDACQP